MDNLRARGQDPPRRPGAEGEETCVVCGFGHGAFREPQGPLWRRPRVPLTLGSGLLLGLGLLLQLLDPALAGPLLVASVLLGLIHILRDALVDLLRPSLSVDFLIAVATLGALLLGDLPEAGSIVFLYSLAEILEDFSEVRAGCSIRGLMEVAPHQATVRRGDREAVVPVEELAVGDVVVIRPGERIPVDGRVVKGRSAVDQATITGESLPVERGEGDEVFAGTVNGNGYLEVLVTRPARDNTLVRIIHMVEAAEAKKARTQRSVERFSQYYTPAVVSLAALVALVPPFLLGQALGPWAYTALLLLLVSCPCALVISTPVSMVSAITSAARRGVLAKGGVHLEALARVDTVVLDKTGTATRGRVRMTDVVPIPPATEREVLQVARTLEVRSEHHLAAAIMEGAPREVQEPLAVEGFEALPGLGVRATVGGRRVYLGNPRLFHAQGLPLDGTAPAVDRLRAEGKTAIVVGTPGGPLGVLGLADEVRPEAPGVVARLRELGVRRLVLLTGDSEDAARAVARALGVDEYRAGMLPGEKARYIQELQARGHRVAMVGDGVNDAPALAAADVGIAMGAAGTYVALETADIALMADDITRLPYLLGLARRARAVVRQNIAASVGVKGAILVLTLLPALLLMPPLVTLWMAVLVGDLGTSLAVIANALRLAQG